MQRKERKRPGYVSKGQRVHEGQWGQWVWCKWVGPQCTYVYTYVRRRMQGVEQRRYVCMSRVCREIERERERWTNTKRRGERKRGENGVTVSFDDLTFE